MKGATKGKLDVPYQLGSGPSDGKPKTEVPFDHSHFSDSHARPKEGQKLPSLGGFSVP